MMTPEEKKAREILESWKHPILYCEEDVAHFAQGLREWESEKIFQAYHNGKDEAFARIEVMIRGDLTIRRDLDNKKNLIFVLFHEFPCEEKILGTGFTLKEAVEQAEEEGK
jgi:hypothetical protein